MPVTARLSKLFYERVGEVVANELVDWFNQVDAAYKFDLKELNEMNFARFETKLELRVTELRAEMRGMETRLDAKIDRTATELKGDLRVAIERSSKDQTRFLFAAWAAMLAAIIPLWFR
jgi:hypothetical protein